MPPVWAQATSLIGYVFSRFYRGFPMAWNFSLLPASPVTQLVEHWTLFAGSTCSGLKSPLVGGAMGAEVYEPPDR